MYSVCRYYSRQHPKDYDIIGKHFYFFILRAPMKNVLKFLIKNICEYDVLFLGWTKITSQHFFHNNYIAMQIIPFFLVTILYPSICNNRAQQLIIRFNIIASGAVRSILLLTRWIGKKMDISLYSDYIGLPYHSRIIFCFFLTSSIPERTCHNSPGRHHIHWRYIIQQPHLIWRESAVLWTGFLYPHMMRIDTWAVSIRQHLFSLSPEKMYVYTIRVCV